MNICLYIFTFFFYNYLNHRRDKIWNSWSQKVGALKSFIYQSRKSNSFGLFLDRNERTTSKTPKKLATSAWISASPIKCQCRIPASRNQENDITTNNMLISTDTRSIHSYLVISLICGEDQLSLVCFAPETSKRLEKLERFPHGDLAAFEIDVYPSLIQLVYFPHPIDLSKCPVPTQADRSQTAEIRTEITRSAIERVKGLSRTRVPNPANCGMEVRVKTGVP